MADGPKSWTKGSVRIWHLLRPCKRELSERHVPERPVRSTLALVAPPSLDRGPCIVRVFEPLSVQAFTAQASVERLDQRVINRLPRPRKLQLHAPSVRPEFHASAGELASVAAVDSGAPRRRTSRLSTRTTFSPPRCRPGSTAKHSPMKTSAPSSACRTLSDH